MKRFLIIVLQIVVSAEITLQVLGFTEPWWSSRAGGVPAGGAAVTILCVGDSHTYGAPLPAEESYPSQLQARLDADSPGLYRVINAGIPGINSAMVSHRFEANLLRYRPDLVILWVGANNLWNEQETGHWDSWRGPGWFHRALLRIKLVRLIRFLQGGVAQAGQGRAERVGAWKVGEKAQWRLGDQVVLLERDPGLTVPEARAGAGARIDLAQMIGIARALEIPILLSTYPYEEFDVVNEAARSVGREFDAPVIDTLADRRRAHADGFTNDELIVDAAGPHPRAPLYGYIVDSMLPRVLSLLAPQ
jgi:hypothetical protein